MSANQQESYSTQGRPHRQEGPKNHFLAFGLSIVLTMLSFAAVMYGELDRGFVLAFIVISAIVQATFQLVYWMHMKDRDHQYPIVFISFGAVIAITAVLSGVYWSWWFV